MTAEDLIDALYTQLDANLETQIAAVESARSVTIERWKSMKKWFDFGGKRIGIVLLPGDTEIDYGDEDLPQVEGIYYVDAAIVVRLAGPPDEVGLTGSRYAEAITAVVAADDTLGGLVDWVYVTDVDWADVGAQVDEKNLTAELVLAVRAKRHG
jgi:hypothetical protein